jgi:hypothetical protein
LPEASISQSTHVQLHVAFDGDVQVGLAGDLDVVVLMHGQHRRAACQHQRALFVDGQRGLAVQRCFDLPLVFVVQGWPCLIGIQPADDHRTVGIAADVAQQHQIANRRRADHADMWRCDRHLAQFQIAFAELDVAVVVVRVALVGVREDTGDHSEVAKA